MRLRMAHRIILLLAFVTLLASMVSGQKIILDMLAVILFAVAIITKLGSLRPPTKKEPGLPAYNQAQLV